VVYLPASMSRSEEQHWVRTMLERFEARNLRQRLNSDGDLQRRAAELNRLYFNGRLTWASLEYVTNQNTRYPLTERARGYLMAKGMEEGA
jgi:hypothetical protein